MPEILISKGGLKPNRPKVVADLTIRLAETAHDHQLPPHHVMSYHWQCRSYDGHVWLESFG